MAGGWEQSPWQGVGGRSLPRLALCALVTLLLAGCGEPASDVDADVEIARLTRDNLDMKMRLTEAQAGQMPLVKVLRTATPPNIDGRGDDPAWAAAEEIVFDINPWPVGQARLEPPTRVNVLYDAEFLYVLFHAESNQWVATEKIQDGKVYQDERVEVFLDADERDGLYHCVEVNPIGTISDYACEFYRGYRRDWSPETLQAAGAPWVVDGKTVGYVVETRIPWNAITAKKVSGGKVDTTQELPFPAKSGGILGVGFYRVHRIPDGLNVRETHSLWRPPWSPIPDYHVPSTFGRMVLE